MTNSILFTIPDNEWLTANGRYHWAVRQERTKALRERAKVQSLNAMRRGQLAPVFGRVHVIAGIQYRTSRVDPANAYPTIKALIDGMTDAGIWPDDDSKHLIGPDFRRKPGRAPKGVHRITLILNDMHVPF